MMTKKSRSASTDRFNRQLHVDANPHRDERTLAKQLAEHSDGKYTQKQIEDQMRIMGVMVDGKHQSGAPATLVGEEPNDLGASGSARERQATANRFGRS